MNDLFIRYANIKLELKALKDRIDALFYDDKGIYDYKLYETMQECRRNSYEYAEPWEGWQACIKNAEIYAPDKEVDVAKLYDERKILSKKMGIVKKAIYLEGLKRKERNE